MINVLELEREDFDNQGNLKQSLGIQMFNQQFVYSTHHSGGIWIHKDRFYFFKPGLFFCE